MYRVHRSIYFLLFSLLCADSVYLSLLNPSIDVPENKSNLILCNEKMTIQDACTLLVSEIERYIEQVHSGKREKYKRIIPRKSIYSLPLSKDHTNDSAIEKDIPRVWVFAEKNKLIREDKDACRVLSILVAHLQEVDQYHQAMLDICAPIAYACVKKGYKDSEIIEKCLVFLEGYICPFVKEGNCLSEKYFKYEKIIKCTPEYASRYTYMDKEDIVNNPVEANSILVWYVRTFNVKALAQIYSFLLQNPLHMSFILFLPMQDMIKKRGARYKGEDTSSAEIKKWTEKAILLDKKYHGQFSDGDISKKKTLILLGIVGAAAAVGAAIVLTLEKRRQ